MHLSCVLINHVSFWQIAFKTTAVRLTFMLLVLAIRSAQCHQHKYNVVNFKAAADGKTDDSQVVTAAKRQQLHCFCDFSDPPLSLLPKGILGDMAGGLQRSGQANHGDSAKKDVLVEPSYISGSLQVTNHHTGSILHPYVNSKQEAQHLNLL